MVLDYCDNVDARGGTFNAVGGDLHNNITIGQQTITFNIVADSDQTFRELVALRTQSLPVSFNSD